METGRETKYAIPDELEAENAAIGRGEKQFTYVKSYAKQKQHWRERTILKFKKSFEEMFLKKVLKKKIKTKF